MRYILATLILLVPSVCFGFGGSMGGPVAASGATEVIRYVNTASSAGGDGTTNATTGDNRAYVDMDDWADAEGADLVTAGTWHHVYATGGLDDHYVVVTGWTTGADNYILIEAAAGDYAVKTGIDTGNYRLKGTLDILEDYVRVKGLQMTNTNSDAIQVDAAVVGASNDIRVTDCYIDLDGAVERVGINIQDADVNLTVHNTAITRYYDGMRLNGNTSVIYQSVISGSVSDGIELDGAATATIKNTAVFGSLDDFDIAGTATATIDYVASDDGDGTNSIAPSGADWSNEFTTPASNFTLNTGGNLHEGGVALTGGPSTDMEGDSWATPPSVGVDEN